MKKIRSKYDNAAPKKHDFDLILDSSDANKCTQQAPLSCHGHTALKQAKTHVFQGGSRRPQGVVVVQSGR